MVRAPLPLLTAAAALLLAAPLAAQHITSPYRFVDTHQSFSIFFGRINTQVGQIGLGPKSGNIYGARLGYRASGPIVLELAVATAPLQRTVRDTARTGPDSTFAPFGTANQSILLVTVDLHFNLTGARTWHDIQPFILLGPGLAFSTTGQNGADARVPQPSRFHFGTSLAMEVGGGVEVYATRRIGLRVDGRGTLWRLKTPTAFQAAHPLLGASEWTQNASLSGGLAYHF